MSACTMNKESQIAEGYFRLAALLRQEAATYHPYSTDKTRHLREADRLEEIGAGWLQLTAPLSATAR